MYQAKKHLEEISSWKPTYGNVYHYTSPEGFQSIIEHQTLRFSRCDCLNDYKENVLIKKLYYSCLEELFEEGKIDKDHYEHYQEINIKHGAGLKRSNNLSAWTSSIPFVCCFSLDPDSLQMWQYYSKGGNYEGYNIGFNLHKLQDRTPIMQAGKILYKEKDKKEVIKRTIIGIYDIDHKNSSDQKVYSVEMISSELAYLGCFFKSECFAGEKEVRVITEIPDDPEEWKESNKLGMLGKIDMPEIHYRMAHAMMIPYFDLSLEHIGTISEITIGPITSLRDETANKNAEIVKLFLRDRLKREVQINESHVPVRY